jgi:hypothetical protein
MKSLWLVARSSVRNATYEGSEYRLGWWDHENQSWRLNDNFAASLLTLLEGLKWGNPGAGDIPDLEIVTRGSTT